MNLRFEQPFEQPAVGDKPYVTAEQFSIRSVDVPQLTYKPGDEVRVTTEYGSDYGFLPTPFDLDTNHPDYCTYDAFGFSPGASLFVEVVGAASNTTDGGCWDVGNNSSAFETAAVPAPTQPGPHTIEIRLTGKESLRVYDTDEIEIQVDEAGDPVPDPPENGNGGNGGNGDNGDGDGDGLAAEAGVVVLAILLVLFIAVALR
jgi:hypothetical protein